MWLLEMGAVVLVVALMVTGSGVVLLVWLVWRGVVEVLHTHPAMQKKCAYDYWS